MRKWISNWLFVQQKMREEEERLVPTARNYQQEFARWLEKAESNPKARRVTLTQEVGHYPLDNPKDDKFRNLANPQLPADMVVNQQGKEPEIVPGKFGNALRLVGDSYVDLGEDIGFYERNEPFTISLWFKSLKDSLEGPVFSRSGGYYNGNRGYDLTLRTDRTFSASLNHTWPANSIEIRTVDKLPVNEWSHLTMTYDGSSQANGIQLYLDGKPMRHQIVTDHLKRSIINYGKDQEKWGGLGNLQIGRIFQESLDGAVADEFRVFDRELSAVEVTKLYGTDDSYSGFLGIGKSR